MNTPEMPRLVDALRSKLPKAWLPLVAGLITFAFVLVYSVMLNASPGLPAVSMLYVVLVGVLWAVAKLVQKVRRNRP